MLLHVCVPVTVNVGPTGPQLRCPRCNTQVTPTAEVETQTLETPDVRLHQEPAESVTV
jgi:hypothetical protein